MSGWTLLVAVHATAATVALVLGTAQLLRRRFGDRLHRWAGRAWVWLTAFVAASSFWIRDLRPGHLSWIHVLSVITLVGVVAVPVRLVPRSFQHDWAGMSLLVLLVTGGALGGLALLSLAAHRLPARPAA